MSFFILTEKYYSAALRCCASLHKSFLQYDASCGAVRHEAIREVDGTEECHMRKPYIIGNIHKGKTAVVMNY